MKQFMKDFLLRGMVAAWFGPLALVVFYLITANNAGIETLSVSEVCIGILTLTALAFTFDGNAVKWSSKEVVTGVGGSLKMGNAFNVVINHDTGATRAIQLPYDVSVTANKE